MENQDQQPSALSPTEIPLVVRIGVTGHRTLIDEERLRRDVDNILRRLDELVGDVPHCYTVVSPLAEGADRLVAKQVLAWPAPSPELAPRLEAILPLPVEEYLQDFDSEASKREFLELLEQAHRQVILPEQPGRPQAYLHAGRTIVQECDVLIAIWNGKPAAGMGGTGDIVDYARQLERWLFWIHDEKTGQISEEGQPQILQQTLDHLTLYNRETLPPQKFQAEIVRHRQRLSQQAREAGLNPDLPGPVWDHLLPHFVRAEMLANRYQRRHNLSVTGVTLLAVLAVIAVTTQVLFFRDWPQLVWIEVGAMALILLLLILSRHQQWHRKWIDYRFLAERLRAAIYLATAGLDCAPPRPLPHSIAHRPNDWMSKAFAWIWEQRPPTPAPSPATFVPVRDFLLNAWIRGQKRFYTRRGGYFHRMEKMLSSLGLIFFGATLLAALIHVLAGHHEGAEGGDSLNSLLIALAIILPVAGAALADIRAYRNYHRNAERYAHMARQLALLEPQIARTSTLQELMPLLEQANEIMLREQQDWRAVLLFQKLEAP